MYICIVVCTSSAFDTEQAYLCEIINKIGLQCFSVSSIEA